MMMIKGYTLCDDIIEEMVELLEKSKIEQIEYGCSIYAKLPDKNLMLRNICAGDNNGVAIHGKYENGCCGIVGDYHTHIGKELPSFFDLDFDNMGNYDELRFIGGASTDRIKCYVIKKLDLGLLNGISELEKMFFDLRSKHAGKPYSEQDKKRITEEFINIHDISMNKLIGEYFEVIEIL